MRETARQYTEIGDQKGEAVRRAARPPAMLPAWLTATASRGEEDGQVSSGMLQASSEKYGKGAE